MEFLPDDQKILVQTNYGAVCGYIERREGSYYAFRGIPYAEPPIGNLRFFPPFPVKAWNNVIDCTQEVPPPFSHNMQEEIIGSEDCLYIEVYTPNLNPKRLLPVMFWIRGYTFSENFDFLYDPSLIINQDIVFVRCGYRTGPFGFLSINDFTAPGNCGLKDLVLALKWVQNNIGTFGGDKNNVTIFGNGSGGALVHFMLLSPMATGLFHKAIMQSASALNNWSLTKNPIKPVMELAKELGIENPNIMEVVEKLRLLPATEIMQAFEKMQNHVYNSNDVETVDVIFKPCIEVEFEGQSAFLSKSPLLIIKSGQFNKVPLIIGSNSIEGHLLQHLNKDFFSNFNDYNENIYRIVPKSLVGETNNAKIIGHQLLKFYLDGEESLTRKNKTQYLQLISDYYFIYYVNQTVKLHREFSFECPIYYYINNFIGEWDVPEDLEFFNSLGHGAETSLIFQIKLPDKSLYKGSRDSIKTRKRVVKMWTNFAKYGNPTPDDNDPLLQISWDPVESKDKLNYLNIGSDLSKGWNPFLDRMVFWEELHKEHVFLRALVHFNDLGLM